MHHPNEIAQSECAFGIHHPERWVKYWLHNEFLQIDGGKMSKSLGNVYTLDDVEARGFSPLDLRYFYFMAQYGNFQNFTRDALEQAKSTRSKIQKKIAEATDTLPSAAAKIPTFEVLIATFPQAEQLMKGIDEAIKDNFNTPKLLSLLHTAIARPTPAELSVLYRLEKKLLKV